MSCLPSPFARRFLIAAFAGLAVALTVWQARRDEPVAAEVAEHPPRSTAGAEVERPALPAIPSPVAPPAKIVRASAPFDQWAQTYFRAAAAERPALIAQGVALAQARRPIFKQLIQDDPRRALAEAVPMVVRQQLPAEILALLETRVNGVGVLRVFQGVPPEGEPAPAKSLTFREAEMRDGKTYRAHVFGRRAESVRWTPGASLNGVALDADMAVNEDPYRVLEVGEVPPSTKSIASICPVSGKNAVAPEAASAPVAETTPAIETATETLFFCDGSHITLYAGTLIMAEGGSGGAFGFTGILPAVPTPSIGIVRVLYMPVTYADQNGVPTTEAKAYELLRDVSDFYARSSYGKLTLVPVVTPPIKLPHTEAWYIQRDNSNGGDFGGTSMEHSHAREQARRMGFDDAHYDCVVMRHTGGPGSYGGLGGGSSVWMRSDSVSTLAHEIGHCFGLAHANFWDTAGTSSIGAGTNSEYGNTYDNMGSSGSFPAAQYNAQAKFQIKWLPANFVQSVTQSGLYRIHAFDQTSLDPSLRYALNIVKDAQRTYWGEVRSQFTANPWAERGMLLGWRFPSGSGSNIQLIDTTPGTPAANNSKDDAPISLGSTFSDFEAGIHITTVNVNPSPRSVDVVVNVGSFPTNQAPTLALAASADVVPVGATVTFTATASDPDGDTLAYSWQRFGETTPTLDPNSAVISRTYATAGTYVMTCTVSDMKGGSATRSRLITVGSGNSRYTISGRITLLGQGLRGVIVKANGANGVLTDSDGYYTIPNLAAGTYTMSPLLYGFTFGELFANAVTVAPNFASADFEATADSVVSIAASLPTANELAPVTAGRFTLTRTGDISAPLDVRVNTAQGSATITTDYTLAPAYVAGSQGFSTFTIPADATSLDIAVTPATDTAAEGPETVTLQLGPGAGYVLGGQASATVTIADDDSALPKVSVSSVPSVPENSASPAVVTFKTAAPVAANLTILYSVSGTATNGTDVTNLPGSALIPNGASSVTVNVAPINDAISEPLETVKLTTTANAAYLIEPQASTVTVNLIDDDVQTVNVAATDPSAAEVDLSAVGAAADTGTFLITRSGDITQPLTVYYSVSGTYGAGQAALHGVDYEALPGVLVIPANQASASVTILPRFDGIGEGNENVLLQLGAGPTNYILGSSASATVTIADAAGDRPVVEIIPLTSPNEGGSGAFRMSVRGAGTGTLAVNFSLAGTATVTSDYTVTTNATLTFDTGTLTGVATFTLNNGAAVTKDIAIVALNDPDIEPLETVVMNITPDAAYQTFAPTATASMWVQDADQPTVWVDTQVGTSAPAHTFTEGASTTPVRFYISRDGASTAGALTVNYTLGGTATSGADYLALGGIATIPAGALGVSVDVAITNDTTVEGTETIEFAFAPGSYAAGNSATMFIADNESPAPTVAFSGTGSRALESAGAVNVPVTLNAAAVAPITVDYIVDTGTRTVSAASFSGTTLPYWVRVERVGTDFRAYRSPNNTTWTQLGATQSMDLPAEVLAGLAVSARSDGALSTAVFDNVTFTTAPSGPLEGRTVGFVTEQGSDSVAAGVYTIIGSGAGLNTNSQDECHFLAAPVTGDFVLTARVVSQSGGATNQQAGVMIRENASYRGRMIYCGAQGTAGLEMNGRTSTFTNSFGVGIDHTLVSGSLAFAIGEQVKNIPFNVLDDTINEPNENLMIVLRNPNGARLGTITQHTFTLEDNDLPPNVPFVGFAAATSAVAEETASANVQVALTAPATAPITVDYAVTGGTATTPGDFTLAAGTLNFAAGESVKSIPVTIADDGVIENPETVTIELSNPTASMLGSIASHTLTINDGDRPVITVAASDATAAEAGLDPGAFTVARTGPPVGNLTVNFTRTGTATSGTDFTAIGTSVVIPDTQASVTIAVTPQPDTTNEGSETVIVTLAADAAYTVGTPNAATVSILDDDRSTVTIVATDPTASETPGDTGTFTVTRTAPTTGSLTVNLTITGTATNGTDYTSLSTALAFTAGQSSRTVTITPTNDAATEGPEVVTLQIASGSYDIGAPGYDDVTILDNDNPPTLYIASPTAQGPLVAAGNGVFVTAVVTDDGAPAPVALQWSQVNGPGAATFDAPTSATSGVTFSADGAYVLRCTASDGQFTVSDQISVNVGAAIGAVSWISQDLNPSSARRGQSGEVGGVFTVSGTGAGYAGTADGAHTMVRQVSGDSSIVARVTALTGTGTPLTGITIRDTMYQGATRAVLGCEPGGVVRFRTRTTTSTADTSTTAAAVLPVWLKLERNATTDEITASYAADNAGAPGAWTQVGVTTAIPMDAAADLGLTTTSNSTSATATAVLDNVTLTPAPVGPALLSEDEAVAAPATPGSANVVAGTYTIAGPPGSNYFHGWQYHGDLMITAKHADATSGAGSARSSICIRESLQSGANAVLGRIPQSAYSGFTWTSIAGGSSGGVPTFTGKVRWVRLIRRGNLVTAFHAADVSGAPGVWTQVGQPQTVIMTPNVLVGFTVNNNSGVGLNTATFTNLSIVPLNKAPIVDAGTVAGTPIGSTPLDGTVTDDGQPTPISLTTQWSGPAGVSFGNASVIDTSASFTLDGVFTLRLTADDGGARTFDTVTFTGYASHFSSWQAANWSGGSNNPLADPDADPDLDGDANLLEYATGTNPNTSSVAGYHYDVETIGADNFLRVTITKNPDATDVTWSVQCTSTLHDSGSWSSAGVVTELNTSTTLQVRDHVPLGATPRFIRASVAQP